MIINKNKMNNLIRKLNNMVLFCFILIHLICCESDSGYTNYKSLSKDGFSSSPIVFNIPENVIDSGIKNLFIHLRNDNNYPYSNIFLIASIQAGNDLIYKDTLEYAMANPDGSWIGKGLYRSKR
jgi:gliding motility-associated lipoprotein GldH